MIIGIPVPNNYFAPWVCVESLIGVKEYPIYSFVGPYIALNRNQLFAVAKEQNESLLFIDDDVVFTPDDVKKIEKHLETLDVVSGIYPMGYPPFEPYVYCKKDGNYELTKPEHGLHKVEACGAGFLGISKGVVKKLNAGAFDLIENLGEDLSFCRKVTRAGFSIWCDSTIRVGHVRANTLYCE